MLRCFLDCLWSRQRRLQVGPHDVRHSAGLGGAIHVVDGYFFLSQAIAEYQVIDLLREVCRAENVAMLLVTHADEVAEQFDRVEYLEKINRVMAMVV